MKKILLPFIMLCCFCPAGYSQSHQLARMLDASFPFYIYGSTTDNLGNLYVTGYFAGTVDMDPGAGTYNLTATSNTNVSDMFLAKYDAGLNLAWAFRIGNTGASQFTANSIAYHNGAVVVGGWFTCSVATDFNPGTGTLNITGVGTTTEAYALKVDVNGNFVWAKAFTGNGNAETRGIAIDASGNVIVAGVYNGAIDFNPGNGIYPSSSASTVNEAFVLKLNSAGDLVWANRWQNNSGADEVYSVSVDAGKNVYVPVAFTGSMYSAPSAGVPISSLGLSDIFVAKLDSNGNQLSYFRVGTADDEKPLAIANGTAGEIYLGGRFAGTLDFDPSGTTNNETSTGGQDCFLAKYTTAGAYLWSTGLGTSGGATEAVTDIAIDASNNVFISGTLNNDPFIFKYNSAGTLQVTTGGVMGGAGIGNATTVALAPWGDIYTCGHFTSSATDFNPGAGTDSLTANNYNGFMEKQSNCLAAATPTVSVTTPTICSGVSDTLRIATGNLNGSGAWSWYTGNCGNTLVGTGLQLVVSPTVTTTYYVRGTGGCAPANGVCSNATVTVTSQVAPTISIAANPGNSICAGTSVTFTATVTNGGTTPTYQWKKNNTNISGATGATYTTTALANNDVITCVLTSSLACASPTTATSTGITMTVTPNVTPYVSVNTFNGLTTACAGTTVLFNSNSSGGGSSPTYQWQKNGVNISGANAISYSTNTLANNDQITCIITSSATCKTAPGDTSTPIVMTITPSVVPTVSISVPNDTVCANQVVVFTATSTNGGSQPTYNWYNGNTALGTTNSTPSYSVFPPNGAVITCRMISNAACAVPTSDTSNAITVTVLNNVAPAISVSQTPQPPYCAGTSVTFTATATGGGSSGNAYQWKKNGANITGATSSTYSTTTLANNDAITCVFTSSYLCTVNNPVTSNTFTQTVNPTVTPAVNITATQNTICSGNSVTFTATGTNGGSSPAYQWKLNGNNIPSATASTYTTGSLSNNDQITCVYTSNAPCATASTATSNTITITVSGTVSPSVTITASTDSICPGETITFTASPINGGASPTYQWKKNGSNISGATAATYSPASLLTTDVFSCVLTSSVSCASPTMATSNNLSIVLKQTFTPTVSVSANPSTVCQGGNVNFSSVITGGGSAPVYQWKVNGSLVNGATAPAYSSTSLVAGDQVSLQLTSNDACAVPVTVTSAPAILTVNPLATPTVTVSASQTVICSGASITFTAAVTNGGSTPTYQWKINGNNANGQTNSTFTTTSLTDGDNVSCVITSNAACATIATATSNSVTVTENSNVIASVTVAASSNAVCAGEEVVFTATPVNGGTTPAYQWKKNNVDISGATAAIYNTATPANGDAFKCEMTSNAACVTQPVVLSNEEQITVNALPDVTVTQSGFTLTVTSASSYQWFTCGSNTNVSGATAASYTATANGSYGVIVSSANGCVDTSTCANVTGVGIDEAALQVVSVYPNPTTGKVKIVLPENILPATVQVTNIIGEKVFATIQPASNELIVDFVWAEGVYLLNITGPNGFSQTTRIIKQ